MLKHSFNGKDKKVNNHQKGMNPEKYLHQKGSKSQNSPELSVTHEMKMLVIFVVTNMHSPRFSWRLAKS